jgi:hypothetical protein
VRPRKGRLSSSNWPAANSGFRRISSASTNEVILVIPLMNGGVATLLIAVASGSQ